MSVALKFGALVTALLLATSAVSAAATNEPPNEKSPAPTASMEKSGANEAFSGIAVESLPPALTSQLSGQIGDGSGVLVADIAPNSPAAKAGVKENDILVSYDQQRLYSPEQFLKLVRNDKPGRQVALKIIHEGKAEKLDLTLAERPASLSRSRWSNSYWPMATNAQAEEDESNWLTFDSLTLSRVDKDHYKAEIRYRDDNGKLETHAFQGSRAQLRKDINAEKDLPQTEREQLLRSLALSNQPLKGLQVPFVEYVPNEGFRWEYIPPERQY